MLKSTTTHTMVSQLFLAVPWSQAGVPYPYERPGCAPVVMGQVPDEEAHDASHDHAGDQLESSQAMEDEAWVMRGCHFGAAIEGVVHRGGGAMGVILSQEAGVGLQGAGRLVSYSRGR